MGKATPAELVTVVQSSKDTEEFRVNLKKTGRPASVVTILHAIV